MTAGITSRTAEDRIRLDDPNLVVVEYPRASAGGVAANLRLRNRLAALAQSAGLGFVAAPVALCTDNAAMAAVAVEKWRARQWAPLDLDAQPNYQ